MGWDPNKRFNLATCLCLFQTRTWISNVICRGCFNYQWEVIVRFVDIGGIVGNHRLNILFTVLLVLSENSLFHRFKLHPRYHIKDYIINKGWKVIHTDQNKNKSQTWLKLKLHFHKYTDGLLLVSEGIIRLVVSFSALFIRYNNYLYIQCLAIIIKTNTILGFHANTLS